MFSISPPSSQTASGPSIPPPSVSTSATSSTMRLCYNGATTLLAATACPAAFVDLDSIREEPPVSPRHFDRDDSVFFRESGSTFGSPLDELPSTSSSSSSPFKFMESIQRKRKSMFRRNQSSSSLVSNEKRRTFRRPSLPSIPPTIDEMSSSVGHARSRRPSLHNDWTNEHQRERSAMGIFDNRIHHIEPSVKHFFASFKDLDGSGSVDRIEFEYHQKLYEVFEPYLRFRGLNVNDVEFFLDKSSTPIPENAEAHHLAGVTVFVRGRGNMKVVRHTRAAHSMDESNDRATRKMSAEAVSRKSSFVNSRYFNRGSRNHPVLNGSDDAECRSNDSSLSVRESYQYDEPSCSEFPDDGGTRRARSQTSSRISLFFEKKDKNEMIRILNQLKDEKDATRLVYKLEENWRDIVHDYQNFSEKKIKQQEAIWEIVTTENRYIKLLRYLADLSVYLQNLQAVGFMKDLEYNMVFINFNELLKENTEHLWNRSIIPLLENTRKTGEPLDVNFLYEGFCDIVDWSNSYMKFHCYHSASLKYTQKRLKDNEQFKDFVLWAESHENLERQKLVDIFSHPMQRLTRYNLLLKAVLKVTVDEKEQEMLRVLTDCCESAAMLLNVQMDYNEQRARLSDIARTIEGTDYVDQDEIEKHFGIRPLILEKAMPYIARPGFAFRTLLHRGDLRIQEGKKGSKSDVHCMLFTDMFLIFRKVQGKKDRLRIFKPPIHLQKLVFHPFSDQNGFFAIPINEFDVPIAYYSFYTTGPEDSLRWTEKLESAIKEYNRVFDGMYRQREHVSPSEENGRYMESQNVYQPMMPPYEYSQQQMSAAHRKSSSMDSQVVAAHHHLQYMHRNSAVSSNEQLNRRNGSSDNMKFTPPRHKLSVASCHANPLSSSKSSVDLYVSLGAENGDIERPRSRSNSSGPDIEGLKQRSRSSSPAQKDTGNGTPAEIESPVTNTPCRDSPTLLITSDDCVEPSHSGRRFEKRYHTADGIDVLKPKGSMLPATILKRFSWNVSSAVNGSRKRLESSRRSSQTSTAASMDSFGSSTSGISTASSNNNNNDPTMEAMTTKLSHISTISINDTPEPQGTLSINLEAPPSVVHEGDEEQSIEVTVPPPPELPPPSKTPSPNIPTQKPAKCQEFLKFIMDNNLETSDV